MTIQLVPTSQFTIEALAAIYNQTRIDYIVPMPMNAARLQEYITAYDVDLHHSLVAMQDDQLLGVAMLGVRRQRAWITRLGVLPDIRRGGVGQALMNGLLDNAAKLGISFVMLEVIKNNIPAHRLFSKLGFREVSELLVMRRSPIIPPPDPIVADAQRLDADEARTYLRRRRGMVPWTNQSETFHNITDVGGISVTLSDDSRGWLIYQRQKFTLTRFAFQTEMGNPHQVAYAFLSHLHHQYPRLDTQIENIKTTDPHLPAFYEMGYIEAFRRIEMWLGTPPQDL